MAIKFIDTKNYDDSEEPQFTDPVISSWSCIPSPPLPSREGGGGRAPVDVYW